MQEIGGIYVEEYAEMANGMVKGRRRVHEGYYFFRVKRQLCPLGQDKLRPEDCRHRIAMDEPADWNMERRIRLVAIDRDGGTIEILED